MHDILDSLKAHDIASLHDRTKISPQYIQALLDRDFSKFTKVQFLGFVSILEREFNLDMSSYKEEFFAHSGTVYEATPKTEVFISEKEPLIQSYTSKIAFVMVGIFLIAFFIYNTFSSDQDTPSIALDDTVIIEAKEQLQEVEKQEVLAQQMELNASLQEKIEVIPEVVVPPKIVVLPKRRVWMGLIEMASGKKVQDIIDSAYDINSSKSWLLVFGHGYIDIEFNKELFEYSERKKLYFLYDDEKLQQINREEFKDYNGGKAW